MSLWGYLPLNTVDDSGQVLHLLRVRSGSIHVDESGTQIVQGAGIVLLTQPRDRPLEAGLAEVDKLIVRGVVHAGTIAPGGRQSNLRLMA